MSELICSTDRWTCPACSRTFVANGSDADIHAAIEAVQRRHAAGHRKAAHVLATLGLPEPRKPRRTKETPRT